MVGRGISRQWKQIGQPGPHRIAKDLVRSIACPDDDP
jgi:hypothetical protein